MPAKYPNKWNVPKLWRLRGKAPDGVTVTLGRYATAEEAEADCQKHAAEGEYRDLAIQAIEPPPQPLTA
ncbi:MAG: hypothetical protein KA383_04280 [Phycisphaerae bacterium]|jgi:hypothetical protein|nr:hypothetical protein [Phycisphaerae bacterium]